MRELFAAAAVVIVLVGGAFLLPVSYNAPVPGAAQRTAERSVAANDPAGRPTVQNQVSGPESVVRSPAEPSTAPVATVDQRTQTTAQAAPPGGATNQPPGNLQAGRQVYRKCQACHSLEPGKNSLGPSLAGIVGKKSGSEPTYNYSTAMRGANSARVRSAKGSARQQDAVPRAED